MKIVLAVDGSKYSNHAVDFVLHLPFKTKPQIKVVQVVDVEFMTHPLISPPLSLQYSKIMQEELKKSYLAARGNTARAVRRLKSKWDRVTSVVGEGHNAEKICDVAEKSNSDLIVLGSRGLSNIKSFLMGSVSMKVAMHAPCSVLVVKKSLKRLKTLVLAIDGSKDSKRIVEFVSLNFDCKGISGFMLNVSNYPLSPAKFTMAMIDKKYARSLKQKGLKIGLMALTGRPAAVILQVTRRKKADMVIVGSRGKAFRRVFFLGSVSHKIVKYSRSSVLVVRGS